MFVILTICRRRSFFWGKKYQKEVVIQHVGYHWNEVEIRPHTIRVIMFPHSLLHEIRTSGRTMCSLVPNIFFAGCEAITGTSFPWPAMISDLCRATHWFVYKPARVQNTCIVLSVDFWKSPNMLPLMQQQAPYTQTLLNHTAIKRNKEWDKFTCTSVAAACMHDARKTTSRILGQLLDDN